MTEIAGAPTAPGGAIARLRSAMDLLRSRQVARDGFWTIALRAVHALLMFLSTAALARQLGAEGYGIYSYAYSLVTLAAMPAHAGLPNLVVRETARGVAQERSDLVLAAWRWSGRVALILSGVVALLLGPVLVIWQGGLQSLPGATMAWALALVPLIALGNLRGAALRGLKRVVEGQLPEYLLRPAILLLLVVGSSLLVCWQASPPAAMALHALASLTAFLLGAWMLWRHTPPAVRSAEPAAKSGGWLASSLIFALLAGFGVFNRQVSTAALGVFQPPDQVGVYRVAVQMATLASFGLQAVRQVAAPRFAGLHARGRVKRLRVLAVSGARVALSFSLLLALGLVLVGRPFLKAVFGPEFEASYWPLLILLVGQVVSSAFGPVGYLLNMAGYEKETVRVMAAVVVLNALLNLVLIPVWGTMAAAVATAASTCTSYLLLWRRARRVLGINSLAFGRTKTQAQVGATG